MARIELRHPANAEGDWFVDTRCIDCDTCRQLAPEVFRDIGEQSAVGVQPVDDAHELGAWRAAVACPTQSIGRRGRGKAPDGLFPDLIAGPDADGVSVFHCGYHSEDSFGAWSWFVQRPVRGNLLVDSPRWSRRIADSLKALGDVDHVLLTHRDDVADAQRYATHFGARVWIHDDDARAAPFASDLVHGPNPVEIVTGVDAHPVPGHSKGSMVFLVEGRYLFTGDSLAWSRTRERLIAFDDAVWYSWPRQVESLGRLAAARLGFTHVLPGHGDRVTGTAAEMQRHLDELVTRISAPARAR
jgi:glyoxylase-like metal-dependent hydrolase (beta-lactamase superfamily II)/ferredoxin